MQLNIAYKNTNKYSKLSHDLHGATGADLVEKKPDATKSRL